MFLSVHLCQSRTSATHSCLSLCVKCRQDVGQSSAGRKPVVLSIPCALLLCWRLGAMMWGMGGCPHYMLGAPPVAMRISVLEPGCHDVDDGRMSTLHAGSRTSRNADLMSWSVWVKKESHTEILHRANACFLLLYGFVDPRDTRSREIQHSPQTSIEHNAILVPIGFQEVLIVRSSVLAKYELVASLRPRSRTVFIENVGSHSGPDGAMEVSHCLSGSDAGAGSPITFT